jgi:hypothetical protein
MSAAGDAGVDNPSAVGCGTVGVVSWGCCCGSAGLVVVELLRFSGFGGASSA